MKNKTTKTTELKELKKLYKDIHKCKICGRFYGSDQGKKEKHPNLCPICEKKKYK